MTTQHNIRIAAAVPTVKVADPATNAQRIIALMKQAADQGAHMVVTPELSVTGATCGDLFRQRPLLNAAMAALRTIARATKELGITAVIGMPMVISQRLYNVAVVASEGVVTEILPKFNLRSDESRWFCADASVCTEGTKVDFESYLAPISQGVCTINGVRCAVCMGDNLNACNQSAPCDIIINPFAAPAIVGRYAQHTNTVSQLTAACHCACVSVGAGFGESSTDAAWSGDAIIASCGEIVAKGVRFSTKGELTIADVVAQCNNKQSTTIEWQPSTDAQPSTAQAEPHPFIPKTAAESEEIFAIQRAGLMQRLAACGIGKCVIGISGGLDSTLALLVTVAAYDALNMCRRDIIGITMPGFGTTSRTHRNAVDLMRALGISIDEISIRKACEQHFEDIGLPTDDRSATYENAQARERTQILMDYAGRVGGIVVGTGDLSELALGWATYNGDHMSMYGVNAGVPKTMVKHLVSWYADSATSDEVAQILHDIVDTPISPELLPADESGNIAQQTEDLVGPYELHDFFIFNMIHRELSPAEIYSAAQSAFGGVYDSATIKHWLSVFVRRFFTQQFKRSAVPDGVKVCSVSLSPRTDWHMPSDASSTAWLAELADL